MSERVPGFEEYTPSRLEWLVVMLNSLIQYVNIMAGRNADCAYLPDADGKTVILRIRHSPDLNPEILKHYEDNAKNFAMNIAKTYKWDSWVEIQTQFDPYDPIETKI